MHGRDESGMPCASRRGGGKGAAEVLEQVIRVLEPDRQPHRTLGNAGYSLLIRAQLPATHYLLRHHQRLGGAETGGERKQLQRVGEAPRRGPAAPEVEADDGAEV